ncbi:mechanosensitive ion channel protein 1, mitochondrial-like [Camellia sinensis]|uniref:mechanosensitive ion channel protein 1, mitochondrial-like n=1 Tax=Camellia sinensis TaxID=4442 RepID=UPI0010369C51|nr:mechanosensitive ion channel protein 1, mitochondrial-like [Camellia sinensis]
MAAIRFSRLKSLCSSINPSSRIQFCHTKIAKYYDYVDVRPSFAYINHNYHETESGLTQNYFKDGFGMRGVESLVGRQYNRINFVTAFSPTRSNLSLRHNVLPIGIVPALNYRSYSSSFGGKGDKARDQEVSAASGAGEPSVSESGVGGSDWVDMVKDAWQSAIDAMTYTGERAKEVSTELSPYVQNLLDSHPYLRDVIAPVGGTLTATILAWVAMPRLLRRFHKYSSQGPAALLSGTTFWGSVPYEKSFWGALEDPLRYLITFMAFSQIGMMVAPTTIASQYIAPVWRGAIIVAFVWFLYRWKTNVISRALAFRSIAGVDREKLLTLDKISSVGLFVLGLMALAEACGVAVQSILTVGGIGGVATAFAARDILGNILSGLSVQISQPFSIGDTIKAGSVEGQVVEMGLTTTSLLSAEKFPIIVPNSLFSSQVIVNKSRARWRAMVKKIPLETVDVSKIPVITEDIKSMLRSNPKVFLEKEPPYCYLSQIGRLYADLTLGCNLKQMSKDELYSTEQDILLQSVQIIKQHGSTLGSRTMEDMI